MTTSPKSIFLYGIHSVNLGDDLFFKIIFERYPDSRFIVKAPDIYKKIFKQYSNCIIISDSDTSISRIIKLCNTLHLPKSFLIYLYIFLKFRISIFLIAGGSLFMEGNSNVPKLLGKIKKIKLIFPKTKICIIGANFGPSKTKKWIIAVKDALKGLDDVCFRDKQSFNTFPTLKNVRWANDIVMHQDFHGNIEKKDILCVNIRSVEKWPTLKPQKEEYLKKTKNIIEIFQKKGYEIKIISFCSNYGDNEISDELYDLLESKDKVVRLYYTGNIDECINAISNADTIIATRFHAIVLGLINGLKILPISYSIKSENMLKTLGIWSETYDYNTYCKLNTDLTLKYIINDYYIDKSNNRQFDYLDKVLKRYTE